jgi:glycosyltransferase XagB
MPKARSGIAAARPLNARSGHTTQPPPPPPLPFNRDIGQLDRAVNDLRRRAPDFSAASPLLLWQRVALLATLSGLTAGMLALDGAGQIVWSLVLATPFVAISVIRVAALFNAMRPQRARSDPATIDRRFDDRLPTFSVLIPLYREAAVAPSLVSAMGKLDYPRDRLEILFVTEMGDRTTRSALMDAGLAQHMRIVIVPTGKPQTKPRALNYALQNARGVLVAVYDAEDIPDRNQLRAAARGFVEGGPRLACLQARLTISNANDSFFSRQFALEYAALFRGILPALDGLGWAIPLGGTSNHFRRDVLLRCGGWDPFNVTEDADLGVRLARLGYEVSLIQSDTIEEAPISWAVWRGQRTRWLKGWMQTYLVHMRRPTRLFRDLGAMRFVGFHITISAMLISMLAHPWFFAFAVREFVSGGQAFSEDIALAWVFGTNFALGYGTAALLIIATARRARLTRHLGSVILLPLYWLAISYAAYRAIFDLIFRPFFWEKTDHGERWWRAAR